MIGKEWTKQPDAFNEMYFRHAIAKAIVFREVEKLVTEQDWYEGGYRANIVAYAIAKLATDVRQRGRWVDFDSIWRNQGISKELKEALRLAAEGVHAIIRDPVSGMSNVTEWAKTQACWSRVEALRIEWPRQWLDSLLTGEDQRDLQESSKKDQKMLNGIEAQTSIVNAGANFWRAVREWGQSKHLLSEKETGIVDVASAIPSQIPSEKQCKALLDILKKLHKEGCQLRLDIV